MEPIIVLVALTVSGICGYFAWRNYSVMRLIKDLPTSPIDEVTNGIAEVQGRVVPGSDVLLSPMGNRECVHYRFRVQERRTRSTGKSASSYWATVIDDRETLDCLVEDDSGRAEVELRQARLILDPDATARSGLLNDAPPEVERLLQRRYGRSSQGLLFNKTMRYTETVLEVGDPLYVLGRAERRGDMVRIGSGGPAFLATDKGERAMASRYLWFSIGLALAAAAGVAFSVFIIIGGLRDSFCP